MTVVFSLVAYVAGAAEARQPGRGAQKLPSASSVLERYVAVTGGEHALLRYKSMTIHGRYQVPSGKVDLETVFYTKDGKLLQKIFLPNGKEYVSGYDGQVAWDLDPAGKVSIREGDIVKSIARDADMYYHLHVMRYFRSMEVVDVKEFNGRPCYHLKGVNNWGQVNEHFYDIENGLLLGYAFNTGWRGGKGDATLTFEDYQSFGGVRMPVRTTSREGSDLVVNVVTSVTYDDVNDEVFALPELVKKAVDASTIRNPKTSGVPR
jgi:hypothetical protein